MTKYVGKFVSNIIFVIVVIIFIVCIANNNIKKKNKELVGDNYIISIIFKYFLSVRLKNSTLLSLFLSFFIVSENYLIAVKHNKKVIQNIDFSIIV